MNVPGAPGPPAYSQVRGFPNTSLKKPFSECTFQIQNLLFPITHPNRNSGARNVIDYSKARFTAARLADPGLVYTANDFDVNKFFQEILALRLEDGTMFDITKHVVQIVHVLNRGNLNRPFKTAPSNPSVLKYLKDGMDFGVEDFCYYFRVKEKGDPILRSQDRIPFGPERSPAAIPGGGGAALPGGNRVPGQGPRSGASRGSNRGHLPAQNNGPAVVPVPAPDGDGGDDSDDERNRPAPSDVDSDNSSDEIDDDDDDEPEEDESEENEPEDDANANLGAAIDRRTEKRMEACTQFDDETWRACCSFFYLDPENQNPNVQVKVRGLKEDFFVYQAYAIFVGAPPYVGGGFCADEQGLGKTRVGLGLCVMEYILAEAWNAVHLARGSADVSIQARHNSHAAGASAFSCPSEDLVQGDSDRYPFAIPCPCWTGSITSTLEVKNGASLIIAPAGLLTVWESEFIRMLHSKGHRNRIDMDLVVLHGRLGAYNKLRGAAKDLLTNSLKILNRARDDIPRVRHSKIIIVTSSGSYDGQVRTPLEEGGRKRIYWSKTLRDEHHLEKGPDTQTIRIMSNAKISCNASPFMWAFSGTPFERNPWHIQGKLRLLSYASTRPMLSCTTIFEDLKYFVQILRTRQIIDENGIASAAVDLWDAENHEKLSHARGDESFERDDEEGKIGNFDWICKEYKHHLGYVRTRPDGTPNPKRANRTKRPMIEALGHVLQALMIRRTMKSRWFGLPIKIIPRNTRHRPRVGKLVGEKYFAAEITRLRALTQAQARGFAPNGVRMQNALRYLRMSATIPGIAEVLLNHNNNWRLTVEELQEKRVRAGDPQGVRTSWYADYSGSDYETHRDLLLDNSEKLEKFDEVVLQKLRPDRAGKKEKIIVLSSFPAVAYIMYMYMVRAWGEPYVILIHAQTAKRQTLLDGFQEATNIADASLRDPAYIQGRAALCVVSTPALIGQGYTLTRAFRVILMEPAWMRRDEEQAFSRVKRISQTRKTHTYRFTNEQSPIELQIIEKQRGRAQINNASLRKIGDSDDFGAGAVANHPIFNANPVPVVPGAPIVAPVVPPGNYIDLTGDSDSDVDMYDA
ncbi:hypothetical protein VTL71DRAFT_5751 [Oculimacula yallundae]|uniref:SNF2 N-terminal domain-containing protein n=1 Tax=Oculimacula yallundae TaxID=86028 RepID=A0ABR4BYD2_9HELO